jgi:hypothetical protein
LSEFVILRSPSGRRRPERQALKTRTVVSIEEIEVLHQELPRSSSTLISMSDGAT